MRKVRDHKAEYQRRKAKKLAERKKIEDEIKRTQNSFKLAMQAQRIVATSGIRSADEFKEAMDKSNLTLFMKDRKKADQISKRLIYLYGNKSEEFFEEN